MPPTCALVLVSLARAPFDHCTRAHALGVPPAMMCTAAPLSCGVAQVCVTLVRQQRGDFQNVAFMGECIKEVSLTG